MEDEPPRLKALIVDDDPGMLSTLSDVLGASGFDVECARTGSEAVERARARPPDCVLMDMRMPDLDGLETFRRLKPVAPDCFVVFMTAYSNPELVAAARRAGAVDVVSKPLDLESLLALIERTAASTPVLVIDDDAAFCRSLGDALALNSFDVRLAMSFEEALESFAREPRQAVVLDMKLNGETGLDLLPRLRELNPRSVVVLISGFPELVPEMRRGLEMSASASFLKPVEIVELVAAIQQAVERRRAS